MNKNLITTTVLLIVLLLGGGYALYQFTDVFDKFVKSDNKKSDTEEVNSNLTSFEGYIVQDSEGDFSVLGLKLKSKENLAKFEGEYVVMEGEVKDGLFFEVVSIDKATNKLAEQPFINLEGEVNSSGTVLTSELYGEFLLTGDNKKYAGELMSYSIEKKEDGYYSIISANKLELVSGAFSIVNKEEFVYKIGDTEFSSNSDISPLFDEGVEVIAFVVVIEGKKYFYKPVNEQ